MFKTMGITSERVNMSNMGATIATTTTNGPTMVEKIIGLDLMFLLKIENLVLRKFEVTCHVLRI